MEQSSGGGGKSSAAASSKTPMIAVQKSLKSFFSSVSKDARALGNSNDFEMKLSQDENRKLASRGDPVEKSSQKKRRSSAFVKSAAETNGTEAANNDSCSTDSTQKVLGNFVESAQKTATRKNTIERTTEEEKKRIERVANATNPTSRTATKKEGNVEMDIDSDDDDDQHPIVRNKRTRRRRGRGL